MIFSALIRPIIGCKADIVLIFIVFIFVSYSLGIADRYGLSFFSIVLSNPLDGGWNIADAVHRSYDLEGMHVGTVAAGRIGLDALRKMKPFDVHLHYFDRHKLPVNYKM